MALLVGTSWRLLRNTKSSGSINLLPRFNGVNISGMPVVLNGLLVGGWRVVVFQVLLCLLNIAIWAPFVKRLDKTEYAQEVANAKAAETTEGQGA